MSNLTFRPTSRSDCPGVCTTQCNTTHFFEERLSECIDHHLHLYHSSRLALLYDHRLFEWGRKKNLQTLLASTESLICSVALAYVVRICKNCCHCHITYLQVVTITTIHAADTLNQKYKKRKLYMTAVNVSLNKSHHFSFADEAAYRCKHEATSICCKHNYKTRWGENSQSHVDIHGISNIEMQSEVDPNY